MFLFCIGVADFFCSSSWIKLFALSLSSALTWWHVIPLTRGQLTSFWMLKSICKSCIFICPLPLHPLVLFCSFSYSRLGQFVKKLHNLNRNIVHMIKNIFWLMEFDFGNSSWMYSLYSLYSLYSFFFQVRVDLCLADHVWLDKRATIAQTVDTLAFFLQWTNTQPNRCFQCWNNASNNKNN